MTVSGVISWLLVYLQIYRPFKEARKEMGDEVDTPLTLELGSLPAPMFITMGKDGGREEGETEKE